MVHEYWMIDWHWELNVSSMAGACSLVQVTCCAWRIAPRSEGRVIETAWYRIEKVVEGFGILNSLDRDCSDFLWRQERKLDALYPGRDRLCDIHGDVIAALSSE